MLPLQNKWIVITRPEHQAENLQKRLQQAGANIILFPLLKIEAPENIDLMRQQQLEGIGAYDLAIFVSPNAVEQALRWMDSKALDSLKIAAIGKKTASVLKQNDIEIDFLPKQIFNSESLLAMSEVNQYCQGRNIIIFRGEGGREHLKEGLQKLGAQVDYIDLYKRVCPQMDLELLRNHYERNELDIILITSGTSLVNLFRFQKENRWLNKVSLLLGSERIQQQALNIPGYAGKAMSIPDPSDDMFYQKLLRWSNNKHNG